MLICVECTKNVMKKFVRNNLKSKDKVMKFIKSIQEEEAISIIGGEAVCAEHLYKELDDSNNWK